MADKNKIAVSVKNITKSFIIPIEGNNGIKQKLINQMKGRTGYRNFTPLNDISFEINKGDFFGIVGKNGSGKSTLLKTIAGIYSPNKGSIQVDGALVPFIELGVGFNPELSGRENIFLNGALLGFSHSEMEDMFKDIVDFAELHDFMEERIKNYSSGMQVRLAFSIAIRARGDILLLDEVLAVGDAAFQQKCFDYFEQLKRDKKTIVFVTHDMGAVQRFCNRALLIDQGSIKLIGNPFEIAELYREESIEDKVENGEVENSDVHNKKTRELTAQISDQNDDEVVVNFEYSSKDNQEMYIGISVQRDGISVAEMTTSLERPLLNKGHVTYVLSKNTFNEGVYKITAALFEKKNRELIAVSTVKNTFNVKGYDITRGGAMKLSDTWVYK